MVKRPLFWLALFFCAGIVWASFIRAGFKLVSLTAVIFLSLSFLSKKKALSFRIFIFCSVFFFGASLVKNSFTLSMCHILRYVHPKNNNLYVVKGIIDGEPEFKYNKTSFVFKAEKVQFDNFEYNTCGSLFVHITGKQDLRYGDLLILTGRLNQPAGYSNHNPGTYRGHLYNQGIFLIMHVKTGAAVVSLKKNNGLIVRKLTLWLKGKMKDIIFRYASLVTANILDAMILGEQRGVSEIIYDSMVKAGTVHILPRLYTKMPSVAF